MNKILYHNILDIQLYYLTKILQESCKQDSWVEPRWHEFERFDVRFGGLRPWFLFSDLARVLNISLSLMFPCRRYSGNWMEDCWKWEGGCWGFWRVVVVGGHDSEWLANFWRLRVFFIIILFIFRSLHICKYSNIYFRKLLCKYLIKNYFKEWLENI